MIMDPLHSSISERQKRPWHFRVFYPSLRFHKERDVRLHGLLIFSVNLLALYLTSLYPQQEWLVMSTIFQLFKIRQKWIRIFCKAIVPFHFYLFRELPSWGLDSPAACTRVGTLILATIYLQLIQN